MKKLLIVLTLLIIFFGCGKNNNTFPNSGISLSNDEFENVSQDGATYSVTVTSNQEWDANCDQEWCSLTPSSGESGTTRMVITIDANTSTQDRNALIIISTASGSKNIEIEQNELELTSGVTISDNDFDDLTSNSISVTTSITSTKPWTASSNQPTWCNVSPTSGEAGPTTLTISLTANSTNNDRDAIITISTSTGSEEIDIEQEGATIANGITIADDDFNEITSNGATYTTTIISGLDWTATSDETWCTITPTSGSSGTTVVTITIAANATTNLRNAEITITSANDKEDIDIEQKGKSSASSITLADNEFNDINSNGATLSTTITSSKSWSAVVAETGTWCKVSPSSGFSGSTKISIVVDKNSSTSDRETIIYIIADDSSETEQIRIEQKGME